MNDQFLRMQGNPNAFAVSLMDAPCKAPLPCLGTCCCMWTCIPSCYWRHQTLSKLAKYPDDYRCMQGYIPGCCGMGPGQCGDQGNPFCMCLEGFCCPMLSLSITRIFMMDALALRPDPVDWQIIQFSNCLQCLSCICDILACFFEGLREVAQCVDCIAD